MRMSKLNFTVIISLTLALTTPSFTQAASDQGPLVAVIATKVKQESWQPTYQTVGSFKAIQGVNLSAEVTATVDSIQYHSGEQVQKGQVLVKLDDQELKAELKQKQAQLTLGQHDYNREQKLLAQSSTSQAAFDKAKANLQELSGAVEQIEAQLSHYTIRAPFSGTVGIRQINLGELVQPGTTIANLQSNKAIYLNFSLPQKLVSRQLIQKTVIAEVSVNGGERTVMGKVSSIDSMLNPDSRTLTVRATLKNDNGLLMPGMFATVKLPIADQKKVLIVPSTAVVNSLYGQYLFTLQAHGKNHYTAMQTPITVIAPDGSNAIIKSAKLKAGVLVVQMGGFKLRNGQLVRVITNEQGQS